MQVRQDDIFRRVAPYAGMGGGLLLFAAAGLLLVTGRVNAALIWLLVAAGLLLIFFIAADPERVMQLLSGRQARYGTNAGLMTVAFIGIFIILNFLATQHNQQWDLTSNGQYTLSSSTIKLVQSLKEPVQIIAFYTNDQSQGGSGKQDAQKLLARYSALSKEVQVSFVDPDANPGQAQQYKLTVVPSLVIASGGRQQIVQIADEPDISSAIQKVTSGVTPKVYFLQGHGEPSLQAASGPSFSQFAAYLNKNNFDAESLNLLTTGKVPTDASLLIEASPTTAYSDDQQQALLDYLGKGGRMLVLGGPFGKVNLDWLTKPYGVTLDNGLVADLTSSVSGQPQAVVVQQYQLGPMLPSPLPPGVYLDTTAVNTASPAPSGVTISPVAQTSADSYLVTDPNATQIDPSKDKKGPFTIAASIEKSVAQPAATPEPTPTAAPSSQPTRLVVFGDSAFLLDQLMSQNAQIAEGNSEAGIAAVKWLTTEPGGIVIPTKAPTDRSMVLLGWQSNTLVFANALFVPILILLAGTAVWLSRR